LIFGHPRVHALCRRRIRGQTKTICPLSPLLAHHKIKLPRLRTQMRTPTKNISGSGSAIGAAKKVPCALGGRGRMTALTERVQLIQWLQDATRSGARLHKACDVLGLSLRCWRRSNIDQINGFVPV